MTQERKVLKDSLPTVWVRVVRIDSMNDERWVGFENDDVVMSDGHHHCSHEYEPGPLIADGSLVVMIVAP